MPPVCLGKVVVCAIGFELQSEAEVQRMIADIDKNGDGRVSSKEWGSAVGKNKAVMQKYFGGKDTKSIGKAFKRIDIDGSGDLTWDEFVAASQRMIAEL